MSAISKIIEITERVVGNQTTLRDGEFEFSDGTLVKKNMPYHIHYTVDKKEHFMTKGMHGLQSKLMFKRNGKQSDYFTYTNLNIKSSDIYLKPYKFEVSDEDYDNGFVRRYYAKLRSNIKDAPVEISEDDYNVSHKNYFKTSVKWRLGGSKEDIEKSNKAAIELSSKEIPNLGGNLNVLELWEGDEPIQSESVKEKLERLKKRDKPVVVKKKKPTPMPMEVEMPQIPSIVPIQRPSPMPLVTKSRPKKSTKRASIGKKKTKGRKKTTSREVLRVKEQRSSRARKAVSKRGSGERRTLSKRGSKIY